MSRVFCVIALLSLAGCAESRHESAFRSCAPSDAEQGTRRRADLQWLLDHRIIHKGMTEKEMGSRIGCGDTGIPCVEAETSHYYYAMGPGIQFKIDMINGVIDDMGFDKEGE